jgi:hypothetical protein
VNNLSLVSRKKTVLKNSTELLKLDATNATKCDEKPIPDNDDSTTRVEKPGFLRQKTNLVLSDGDLDMSCPICLGEFKEGDTICWSHNPSCTHAFHMDCIEEWLIQHDRCPCCRNDYLVPAVVESPPGTNETRGQFSMDEICPLSRFLRVLMTRIGRANNDDRSRNSSHHSDPPISSDRSDTVESQHPHSTAEGTLSSNDEERQEVPYDIETALSTCGNPTSGTS